MMLLVKSNGAWRIVAQAWGTEDAPRATPAELLRADPNWSGPGLTLVGFSRGR